MKKIPYKIKKKIQHMYGKTYGGYLTPTEISDLLLVDGVKPKEDQGVFNRYKKALREGTSNPMWFYFSCPFQSTSE